jgi:hypothetical protein
MRRSTLRERCNGLRGYVAQKRIRFELHNVPFSYGSAVNHNLARLHERLVIVRCSMAITVAAILLGVTVSPARADNAFQCNGGANAALVNACGARWEAANIRAHIAAQSNGGYTTACLTKTADLLDQLATKWVATNAFTAYTGVWPCGKQPTVATADDGALSQACPKSTWSYDNKGKVACTPSAQAFAVAVTPNAPAPKVAVTPSPCTGDWQSNAHLDEVLASNEEKIVAFDFGENRCTGPTHDYRTWAAPVKTWQPCDPDRAAALLQRYEALQNGDYAPL